MEKKKKKAIEEAGDGGIFRLFGGCGDDQSSAPAAINLSFVDHTDGRRRGRLQRKSRRCPTAGDGDGTKYIERRRGTNTFNSPDDKDRDGGCAGP